MSIERQESSAVSTRERLLLDVLQQFWGYSAFRPHQREAVAAIDSGRDTVVVLPTGGGKSLCYQLPAITRGRALVISPLISLMQDQVTALRQLGVEAEFINSTVSPEDFKSIVSRWGQNQIRLLYIAPERLASDWFLGFIARNPPAFFAIDEAHCISHWGHDFRPEYRKLRILRERFASIPICALTATATEPVRGDIVQQALLRDPQIVVGHFDRPNLHYRVEQRTERNIQIEDIIRAHSGKGGIVYCISRKDTEDVSKFLSGKGLRVAAYHAGLDGVTRRNVQNAFTTEQLDAVVATVAFGMGIDRSNVRFVVHAAMPAGIEHYQQETGRAGRDGLPAECVLLFSHGDPAKWRSIYSNDETMDKASLKIRLDRLKEMERYAKSSICRHRQLVEYFGQTLDRDNCGNCDNCGDTTRREVHPESTIIAQKILSCVIRLEERFGAMYLIRVLRGETEHVQPVHCGLSTFGLMAETSARQLRDWIEECITQDLLYRSDDQYPVLKVSVEGWGVLRRQRTASMSMATVKPRTGKSARQERIREHGSHTRIDLDPDEGRLFEQLRSLRARLAKERKVAAYVIFHDTTLRAIAKAQPTTLTELERIPGVGERKLHSFGEEFVDTVNEWQAEQD